MPWNDNKGGGGGGPWGGGGGGGNNGNNNNGESPWGKPPGGQGPKGPTGGGGGGKDRPDLEETLRRMQERFRRKGGSGGGSGNGSGRGGGARGLGATGVVIILVIALVGWALTGVYQVNEQERAVVLRFGTFHRFEEPGFKIRLPSPIEQHYTVEVNTELRTPIGGEKEANLMLTGDEAIVDIGFTIIWRISDPYKYLFNVVDQDGSGRNVLLEQIGESAMREVVGTSSFEPITTGDRTGVELRVRDLMQQTLNSYDAGIEIISIAIGKATAPEEVVAVQREVSGAEQNKARREAEAIAHRNRVVPEAEGRARAILQEAEGYKQAVVAEAKGAADAFNLIYAEYRAAPRVTRDRLFLEMMERVLGRTDNTIIDTKSGAVPIIPLDQLRGRQPAPQGQ